MDFGGISNSIKGIGYSDIGIGLSYKSFLK